MSTLYHFRVQIANISTRAELPNSQKKFKMYLQIIATLRYTIHTYIVCNAVPFILCEARPNKSSLCWMHQINCQHGHPDMVASSTRASIYLICYMYNCTVGIHVALSMSVHSIVITGNSRYDQEYSGMVDTRCAQFVVLVTCWCQAFRTYMYYSLCY